MLAGAIVASSLCSAGYRSGGSPASSSQTIPRRQSRSIRTGSKSRQRRQQPAQLPHSASPSMPSSSRLPELCQKRSAGIATRYYGFGQQPVCGLLVPTAYPDGHRVRDYERTLAMPGAFTTVEGGSSPSSEIRNLMLADVVVVTITLLITAHFFERYGRGR
jgi:hypothetical protein